MAGRPAEMPSYSTDRDGGLSVRARSTSGSSSIGSWPPLVHLRLGVTHDVLA